MRQEPEFFGDEEMDLLFIAKKLWEAQQLEEALNQAGIDYAVEVDDYKGGIIFQSVRKGAFFYVLPDALESARATATAAGFRPHQDS